MTAPITPDAKPLTAEPLTKQKAWEALGAHYQKISQVHLRELFAEDPKRVLAVLRDTLRKFAEDPSVKAHLEGEPRLLGIEDVYAGYFTVLLQVKTNPGQRLEMMRELRIAALHRLREEGISVRPAPGATGPA